MSRIQPYSELMESRSQSNETIWNQVTNLVVCTFQTVFGYMCLDICVAISLHYISQSIGSVANAGYGFALTCVSILILPIGFGLNQSLNMHTSQALGDKKIQLAKRFFNINLYVMLFLLVPLGAVLLGIVKYPLSLTINEAEREQTSEIARDFLYYLIPAVILAMEFESAKMFMIAHKVTYPFTFIHFITLGTHWFFSWFLISELKWGIAGAGWAIILTELFNILGLLAFVRFTNIKDEVFKGTSIIFDVKRFKKLGRSYIKTSIPILMHIYIEFFVFFLLSFVALSLGTAEMNAHLGIQSINQIFFRVPISLSIALMSYVGTEMGRKNVKKAKTYIIIGLILCVITSTLCSILTWFLQDQLADFYTVDDENASNAKELFKETIIWEIYAIILLQSVQGTLSGVCKGINLVNMVFYSTLVAYYAFCIPVVFYCSYDWGLGKGVLGIWQGFGAANLVLAAFFLILLFTTDLKKESDKIIHRVKLENELQQSTQNSAIKQEFYE